MTERCDLRTHAEIRHFVNCVRTFCELLETDPDRRQQWLNAVLVALADIYAAAHHLPDLDDDFADDYPEGRFDPTPQELARIRYRLAHIFGEDNLYWCNLNVRVLPSGPEPGQSLSVGDLTDDLTDIYRDVLPGLRAWDENIDAYLPDIIFDWKEPLIATHWGAHAVDAIQALHNLVYGDG